MKPTPSPSCQMNDFFRSRLTQMINMNHELVQLADRVDWSHIDTQLQPFFANVGRRAIPSRLMVGLHLLKSMYCLSDEAVCERWVENPYYQYFCGEEFFQHRFPIQRSSMTHWRKRVGEDFFQKLLQESLRIAFEEKAIKTNQLTRVVVDTTVQPKAVSFPTDVNLMSKAINGLVRLAKENNVELRQTYQRVVKRALIKSGRYRHAKQMRRAKREEKFIRVRLGRILRDVRRKIEGDDALRSKFSALLRKAAIIYTQSRHSTEKLYSLHAPETECIGKGKAHKPYEFGCKVSVTVFFKLVVAFFDFPRPLFG
jgi:transposase, IS5 family